MWMWKWWNRKDYYILISSCEYSWNLFIIYIYMNECIFIDSNACLLMNSNVVLRPAISPHYPHWPLQIVWLHDWSNKCHQCKCQTIVHECVDRVIRDVPSGNHTRLYWTSVAVYWSETVYLRWRIDSLDQCRPRISSAEFQRWISMARTFLSLARDEISPDYYWHEYTSKLAMERDVDWSEKWNSHHYFNISINQSIIVHQSVYTFEEYSGSCNL